MKRKRHIGIRELKNRTSRVVDEVRESEEVYVVTKRGRPVAVIRPWNAEDARTDRAQQVQRSLAGLSELADRVARAAGKRSARAAVSEQRR